MNAIGFDVKKSREADPFALPLAAIWRMSLCRSNKIEKKKKFGEMFFIFLDSSTVPPSGPRNIWRNLTKTPLDGWRFTEPPLFNYSQSAAGAAGPFRAPAVCRDDRSTDITHTHKRRSRNKPLRLHFLVSSATNIKLTILDGNVADRPQTKTSSFEISPKCLLHLMMWFHWIYAGISGLHFKWILKFK